MENKISIGRINGTDIFAVASESGETFVPIKPICTALGIAFSAQYTKIKEDLSFSSVVTIIVTTGADGKQYEMVCLPHRRIYGWLYTINPGKVAPEASDTMIRYRDECNDLMYDHFFTRARKLQEIDVAEREKIAELAHIDKQLNAAESNVKELKAKKAGARSDLDKIRSARLDDRPSLFD